MARELLERLSRGTAAWPGGAVLLPCRLRGGPICFRLRDSTGNYPSHKEAAYMRDERLLPIHDQLMVPIDLSDISFS
jgi:hypothetical protein